MKFSIVTPVYNGEKYIAETIESVLSQAGDFEIEYIVADGGSSDGTVEILKSYEDRLKNRRCPVNCKRIDFKYFSNKDRGMYDAIQKGFANSTGEIMAYLNADDIYRPGAFKTVASILETFPEVEWLKGRHARIQENGTLISEGPCFLYDQEWLRKGIYGHYAYFVQQETVFWKRTLWQKAHPPIPSFKLAGDYLLWKTFAGYAPLWSFNKTAAAFRIRKGQLSSEMEPYRQEQRMIEPAHPVLGRRIMLFFAIQRFLNLNPRGFVMSTLSIIFFPLQKPLWYIDFDQENHPLKKKTRLYIA